MENVKKDVEVENIDNKDKEIEKKNNEIKINEFKIRQAPPVIKLKERSVGIGRLYPIVE